jgi:putative redox protein
MECVVRWTGEGMSFVAESGSGHLVPMDGSPDGGGRNLAPRPMEMVLIGTGACTAYDVVLILKRGRHRVRACEVSLQAERAPTDPKVFTSIAFRFTVRGDSIPPPPVAPYEKRCCDGCLRPRQNARPSYKSDQQRARERLRWVGRITLAVGRGPGWKRGKPPL